MKVRKTSATTTTTTTTTRQGEARRWTEISHKIARCRLARIVVRQAFRATEGLQAGRQAGGRAFREQVVNASQPGSACRLARRREMQKACMCVRTVWCVFEFFFLDFFARLAMQPSDGRRRRAKRAAPPPSTYRLCRPLSLSWFQCLHHSVRCECVDVRLQKIKNV